MGCPCLCSFSIFDVASSESQQQKTVGMETAPFIPFDDVIKPHFGNYDIIILSSDWLAQCSLAPPVRDFSHFWQETSAERSFLIWSSWKTDMEILCIELAQAVTSDGPTHQCILDDIATGKCSLFIWHGWVLWQDLWWLQSYYCKLW